ncbi:hypothetical protein NTE_00873 [Candidatus Nitrososphaera evergladensis SR1]|uniref:Uncharacterized protein n=1 Tax=Candidatus Nitrososphaera evergladensis SR1 TaxID=1459636 RepID=A0A075MUD7_9ARCH|nr:hypothetical protein NTE_00873 [Candidatus Nitrososphaera evergladensis SR1]
MSPYYNEKDTHDRVVAKLARCLKEKYPLHTIEPNVKYRRKRQGPPLRNGRDYYPDVVDYTDKIAYEVHWKGSRKEESFDWLPEGWKGVNVFIDDMSNPFAIIVRMPGYGFTFVECQRDSDPTSCM